MHGCNIKYGGGGGHTTNTENAMIRERVNTTPIPDPHFTLLRVKTSRHLAAYLAKNVTILLKNV
jgi:hypothetical protein